MNGWAIRHTDLDELCVKLLLIEADLGKALDGILAAEGDRVLEDFAGKVNDGVGTGAELADDLERVCRLIGETVEGLGDVGEVDDGYGLVLEKQTWAETVAVAEGVLDEGGVT